MVNLTEDDFADNRAVDRTYRRYAHLRVYGLRDCVADRHTWHALVYAVSKRRNINNRIAYFVAVLKKPREGWEKIITQQADEHARKAIASLDGAAVSSSTSGRTP